MGGINGDAGYELLNPSLLSHPNLGSGHLDLRIFELLLEICALLGRGEGPG